MTGAQSFTKTPKFRSSSVTSASSCCACSQHPWYPSNSEVRCSFGSVSVSADQRVVCALCSLCSLCFCVCACASMRVRQWMSVCVWCELCVVRCMGVWVCASLCLFLYMYVCVRVCLCLHPCAQTRARACECVRVSSESCWLCVNCRNCPCV